MMARKVMPAIAAEMAEVTSSEVSAAEMSATKVTTPEMAAAEMPTSAKVSAASPVPEGVSLSRKAQGKAEGGCCGKQSLFRVRHVSLHPRGRNRTRGRLCRCIDPFKLSRALSRQEIR